MSETLHVLIVEDNPADVDLMRNALPETGPIRFHIESVPRLSDAIARFAVGGIDIVMTDLGLPDSQELATYRDLRQAAPDLPIIVLTGSDDQEMAVAAVREGAHDFLIKDQISGDLLVRAARYAIERKNAEAQKKAALSALQRSEARYLAIIEEQTELVCRYLPDGRLSFVNESYVRYFGKKRQDIMNLNYIPNIPASDIAVIDEHLKTINQKTPLTSFEHQVIMPDGTIRWQYWTHRGIYSSEGELIEYQAVGQDITERKRAEEALQEAAKVHENLIRELQHALENVKTLQGLIPICAHCKKIRDDKGFWNQVEGYIMDHSDATFTHGICPDCGELLYGNLYKDAMKKGNINNENK